MVEGSQRVKERAQNGWLYWFPFDSVTVEVPLRFQELALVSHGELQQQPDLEGDVLLAGRALDGTQPGLPMKKGRCGTMTLDYKRNGTTALFAALNVLEGTVVGECMCARHQESCASCGGWTVSFHRVWICI